MKYSCWVRVSVPSSKYEVDRSMLGIVDDWYTRGWIASAKSMSPRGSPCCTKIEKDIRNPPKHRWLRQRRV